jgi:BirA family biotin operon repressor/biotin-[acetyl-CoA-carboxylase] ligase
VVTLDGGALNLVSAEITRFVHEHAIASTMDRAHELAEAGAPSGTVVVADVQTAGRGRGGKAWQSHAGDGLWCTVLERVPSVAALDVLSLRVGLAVLACAQPLCDSTLGLKWPNDVVVRDDAARGMLRKLAGVLIEARWREAQVEWVAIGIGINLHASGADLRLAEAGLRAAKLREGVGRVELLERLIPAVRSAARSNGLLTEQERVQWHALDAVMGRRCVSPSKGVVAGVESDGALCVRADDGALSRHRSGSLILTEENATC